METVSLSDLEEYRKDSVVNKVPILTDTMMVKLLFITKGTEFIIHGPRGQDEVHYIIKGSGVFHMGKESEKVREGMFLTVTKDPPYHYSASDDTMIVGIFNPIKEFNEKSKKR